MEVNDKILKYLTEAKIARQILSSRLQIDISDSEFQSALGSVLGYSYRDSFLVYENELTSTEMLQRLENYEFGQIIDTITFEGSILPDGMPQLLTEERVKIKGEIWTIHKNDKDPFPSNPHAHNYSFGYKLHLGTGELFENNNKPLNKKITKKHLLDLRSRVKSNIDLPDLSYI